MSLVTDNAIINAILDKQHGYPKYTEKTVEDAINWLFDYENMPFGTKELFDLMYNDCVNLEFIVYKLNIINKKTTDEI